MDWIPDHLRGWSWSRVANGMLDIPDHWSQCPLSNIILFGSHSSLFKMQCHPHSYPSQWHSPFSANRLEQRYSSASRKLYWVIVLDISSPNTHLLPMVKVSLMLGLLDFEKSFLELILWVYWSLKPKALIAFSIWQQGWELAALFSRGEWDGRIWERRRKFQKLRLFIVPGMRIRPSRKRPAKWGRRECQAKVAAPTVMPMACQMVPTEHRAKTTTPTVILIFFKMVPTEHP